MEIRIDILRPFFNSPNKGHTIRSLAKATKINHTTVRQHLIYYLKEGLLKKRESDTYATFIADINSKKYANLKLFYNLELIRESGIVESLEKAYDYPPIILFGSFAKAADDENSDIDICIISDIKNDMDLAIFEKKLPRKISLHKFTKKMWNVTKDKNPELINNIANGIMLSGQLEIL